VNSIFKELLFQEDHKSSTSTESEKEITDLKQVLPKSFLDHIMGADCNDANLEDIIEESADENMKASSNVPQEEPRRPKWDRRLSKGISSVRRSLSGRHSKNMTSATNSYRMPRSASVKQTESARRFGMMTPYTCEFNPAEANSAFTYSGIPKVKSRGESSTPTSPRRSSRTNKG